MQAPRHWMGKPTFHAFDAFHASQRHATPRLASSRLAMTPRCAMPGQPDRSWVDLGGQLDFPNAVKFIKYRYQDALRLRLRFLIEAWSMCLVFFPTSTP